jgi:phage terminase Nu1 subunit (DNA packaging protein)
MPQSYPVNAIATLLKLSERRVQQLVKDSILPRPVKGMYDPIACVHAYIDYLKKLAAGNGELSLTDERTRLTKYQADLAEIELRKAHGELIGTKKAMQLWGEVVTSTRQRLLGLPTRLASIVAQQKSIPEIKDIIENAIQEVLSEFANPDLQRIARVEGDTERIEGLQTPAKADRKRVGGQKKKTKLGK